MEIKIEIYLSAKFKGVEYWSAVAPDFYDVDCDLEGYYSLGGQGIGHTKWEAVRDLIDWLEENDSE